MKINYTKDFRKSFKKLPKDIQNLFIRQESLLKKNWRDPRLHVKELVSKQPTFSIRITQSYRALFIFTENDMVIFYDIGHRKDIYK